ncbi:MAG: DCC1-like thiol-disulfide oxidoreductase family protein [Cyanophyceae cyanobacterium]
MHSQSSSKLAAIFGLDRRSLAVFRIGLALIVIADLMTRLQALQAHYTDAGVLPGQVLERELLRPGYWSLHLISGHFLIQALLFFFALLIALAMLVGYRTRLATIATWALTVSLQNRNPALIFALDDVLRAVLFWAMFLPLGACYSVDSALNSSAKPLAKRVVSGATAAFIVQLCFIYVWSAVYKTQSPIWWPDGDAVYYSLSFDQYVTEFGQFLLGFPLPFLRVLTFAALVFEILGPLLLFIPWRTSLFRCLAIVSFILLHIGFELCFSIGLLSYLSIVNWLALIPSPVWDQAAKKRSTPQRRGLKIYYDADCNFCKKVVHLIRTFLILPQTPLLTAQGHDSIYADMVAKNSWVVVDWQGSRHFKFEALAYLCSLSPFKLLSPVLRWKPVATGGKNFYELIANNRQAAGNLTKPLKFRPLEIKSSPLVNGIVFGLLLLTTLWNFKGFVNQRFTRRPVQQDDWISSAHQLFNRRTFQRINVIGYLTRLDQSWSIFAPAPPRDDGWHVVVGTLKDGTQVNLLQEGRPISWEKPSIRERQALYKTIQWRVYFINLNRAIGQKLYPYYGNYLCRQWNRQHKGDKQLVSLEIFFIDERTVPPGNAQKVEKTTHLQRSCDRSEQIVSK